MIPIDHEDNRERFNASSDGVSAEMNKCKHQFTRTGANTIECAICHNGWRFESIPKEILNELDDFDVKSV